MPKLQLDSSELGSAGLEDGPAVGSVDGRGGAEVEAGGADDTCGVLLDTLALTPVLPPAAEGPATVAVEVEVVEPPCCVAKAMGLKVQPSGSTTPAGKPASPCLNTGPLAKYACGTEEEKPWCMLAGAIPCPTPAAPEVC